MNDPTRRVTWTTLSARGSAALVAAIAGWSSFRHIAAVAIGYGEAPAVAYALPFAIDGLMVTATMAMIEDKRSGRKVRGSARVAFLFGVLASLGANVASAAPVLGARVVASVPAVALLLSIEVLSRTGRPLAVPGEAAEVPQRVPATAVRAETRRLAAQLAAEHPGLTVEQVAARLGISARAGCGRCARRHRRPHEGR